MPVDLEERPLPNTYWVLPGEFLAGEHPGRGTDTAAQTRERLRRLMDAGIDCFVDLTLPDELPSYEEELPEGVEYLRFAVRDHGIPAQREHMLEILSHIERALRAGRRVYVHCRAGIGRTGTVAGCFLIERGETGDSAIERLNDLWQQSQRSQTWPYVPETDEQTEFVRGWAPSGARHRVTPPAVPPKRRRRTDVAAATAPVIPVAPAAGATAVAVPIMGFQDRFRGALLGLAIGDALAAATQGRKAGSFEPVVELSGGGPFDLPAGAWSDDTAMALCLAESLLQRGGFDPHDQVARYTRWQSEGYLSATGVCVGITASTAKALSAAQWRRQVFAGSHDPRQLDPEVLSRVAPAVMFAFGSPQEAVRLGCEAARTTCQAPLALEACQLLAALVYGALAGERKAQVLSPGLPLLDVGNLRARVSGLLRTPQVSKPPRAGGSALDVLAAALWCFQVTGSFREGALRAANLGGHSDAIAAVYGQLAGAHYGATAIPLTWRNALAEKALVETFAERLFRHARPGAMG